MSPMESLDVLENGGIDQAGSLPTDADGWYAVPRQPPGVELRRDNSRKHTGEWSLCIDSRYAEDRPWFGFAQPISRVRSSTTYTLSGFYWSEDLNRSATVMLWVTDKNGVVHKMPSPTFQPNSRGWKKFQVTWTSPASAVRAVVKYTMHGSGRVWIDDVALSEKIGSTSTQPFGASRVLPLTSLSTPLDVDGLPKEWKEIPRSDPVSAYKVSNAEAVVMEREDSAGAADLSFTFSLAASPQALCLLVEVQDDERHIAKPYWSGDSVQIAIDPQLDRTANGFGADDLVIGFQLTPHGVKTVFDQLPDGVKADRGSLRVAAAEGKGTYTIEAAIPWKLLQTTQPAPNQAMGFNIVVNDSDGGKRKWAEWASGLARDKSSAAFGRFVSLNQQGLAHVLQSEPRMRCSRPWRLRSLILSNGSRKISVPITLRIDEGATERTFSHNYEVARGVTAVDLMFPPDSLPAGLHTVVVELAGTTSSSSFEMRDINRPIDALLTSARSQMSQLEKSIEQGRQQQLDMAVPDVTLCVAELFQEWIPLDREREGSEDLAIFEAEQLGGRLARAISEAKAILADPQRHSAITPPDVLRAKLQGANWTVDGNPVLLIGFNQMSVDHLTALKRLGGNFNVVSGGNAAWFYPTPEGISAESVEEHVSEPIRRQAALGIRSSVLFGHRMPRWFLDKYPDAEDAIGHFFDYDIDHPEAVALTYGVAQYVAARVKDLPGFTSYDLWNEAAYSRVSARGLTSFRAAMREKYGDIDSLNAVWGQKYESLDAVRPIVQPERAAAYTDFCRWNDDRFYAFCAGMRQAVRRGDPQALTAIKFGNESMVCGSVNQAHRKNSCSRHGEGKDRYRLAQLLEINACDTRPTRASEKYAFDWEYQGMCYDIMRSFAPGKPIFDSEWHGIQTVYFEELGQPPEYLNAALWWSYLHGMDMNITWWWGRQPSGEPKAEWFAGGMLTQPQLLDAFGRNNIAVQRHAREIVAFQDDTPRVRILFSKTSAIHDLDYLDTQRDLYETLNWLGIPIGWVSEPMLTDAPPTMNLLIVPNARHTTPAIRNAIEKLQSQGVKVVCVGDKCLSLDPYGRPLDLPAVTAPTVSLQDVTRVATWENWLTQAGISRDVVCTGAEATGSKPVEFRSVELNGERLLYYVGLGKTPVDVRFEVNGHEAKFTSLIDGRSYSGQITVAPYAFDLVRCR